MRLSVIFLSIAINELRLYANDTPVTKLWNQLFDKNLHALSVHPNTPEKPPIED